jgi:hypothetical protein
MDPTRLTDLIHAELDVELSAAERAELARLVLQDPDARRLQDELKRTHGLLGRVTQADPPAGLRTAILKALGLSEKAGASGSGDKGWSLYRLAAAVIGGLVVVGIGYNLLEAGQPGADLQGSLGAALPSVATQAAVAPDHANFTGEGVQASASLHRGGQGLQLELELGGTVPYEVVARFDPAATSYAGPVDEAGLAIIDDAVTVQAQPGRRTRVLEFSATAPIRVQVRMGGHVLGEEELSLEAGN